MIDHRLHLAASIDHLDEDDVVKVVVGDLEIALYNLGGEFFATELICTHAYASLADGYIEDGLIECPLHAGTFDIRTGEAVGPPCTERLRTYDVVVDGNQVFVRIPDDVQVAA